MRKSFLYTTLLVSVLFFSACTPKIVGTWNVDKYETKEANKQSVTFTNIGTMSFDKKGSGQKNISYLLLNYQNTDNEAFTWTIDNKTIMNINSGNSTFSKAWIILESNKKVQKWKSTDGGSGVQTIEMSKKKD